MGMEEVAADDVRELITGLTTVLAEAMEAGNDAFMLETFSKLDEQFSNDPASVLILLKASLILSAGFALKLFKGKD